MKAIKILKPVTIASVAAENPPRNLLQSLLDAFIYHNFVEEINVFRIGHYLTVLRPETKNGSSPTASSKRCR